MKNSAPNIAILKEQKAASAPARYIRGLHKSNGLTTTQNYKGLVNLCHLF